MASVLASVCAALPQRHYRGSARGAAESVAGEGAQGYRARGEEGVVGREGERGGGRGEGG